MKLMLASTACLTLSVAMVAQEVQTTGQSTDKKADTQHQHHMRGGKMKGMRAHNMQHMATELGLSEAQKTQIKTLHEQQRTKMQELRANESLTKEQKMEQFKALHESTQSQVNSLLTPEQQTKFTEMKANRKARMGKHGKGRRGAWSDKADKTDKTKTEGTTKQ